MKPYLTLLLAAALSFSASAQNHKHHHHHHKIKAPNGGRILHKLVPHAEFLVTKDRKIKLTFVDDKGKAITSAHTLQMIAGKRSAPTKFNFEKTKNGFISKEKLPEGKLIPVVLTFSDSQGKKKRIRFNVNMAECPTCDFKEYACTCDHDHDH